MAGSTVSGIGSNIDTQAIVTSLVNAEKVPKQTQINTASQKATTTLSSIGKIQAALDAFRGALDTMTTSSSFTGLSGSSSDEKVATMTASNTASNGSFRLIVDQLAQASKLSTRNFTGGTSTVVNATDKATTLTITQSGKAYDLSVPTWKKRSPIFENSFSLPSAAWIFPLMTPPTVWWSRSSIPTMVKRFARFRRKRH